MRGRREPAEGVSVAIGYRRCAMIALGLFTLNLLWEMAQARFYSSMSGLPFWSATWLCTRAAAADVGLLALCFGIVALVARDASWPLHPTSKTVAAFLAVGLLATVGIEHWALATRRWSYRDEMPMIFGVGALPLLQWVLMPVLSVLAVRLAFPRTLRRSDTSCEVREEQIQASTRSRVMRTSRRNHLGNRSQPLNRA